MSPHQNPRSNNSNDSSSFSINHLATTSLEQGDAISRTANATPRSASSIRDDVKVNVDLVKQMITRHHKGQKIHPNALLLTSELIRLFVIEARERAKNEAEYDTELLMAHHSSGNYSTTGLAGEEEDDDDNTTPTVNQTNTTDNRRSSSTPFTSQTLDIQGNHIVKIATELLLDFS